MKYPKNNDIVDTCMGLTVVFSILISVLETTILPGIVFNIWTYVFFIVVLVVNIFQDLD